MRRYPRMPHVAPGGGGTRDDLILDDVDREELLSGPVVVEEKLDGANVALWVEDGVVRVASRGGADAQDRAGQLGRLRAWAGPRSDELRELLDGGSVLFGEWLLLTHTVPYDALPDHLVGLDLVDAAGRFAPVDERDERMRRAGIAPPPRLHRGTLRDLEQLDALLGRSRVGSERAEGAVVRADRDDERCIAKRLAPGFVRIGDEAWERARPHNVVGGR